MYDPVISRRDLLTSGAAIFGAPFIAHAQPAPKVPRAGVLFAGVSARSPQLEGLWQGLRDLGYVDGRNIVIDFNTAEGHLDRLPQLAAELVAHRCDVIVAPTPAAVGAAKAATLTIPIVMLVVSAPVELGFVKSFARPGGNVTGITMLGEGLAGKRLQLLKEVVPGLSRVAVIWNPTNPGNVTTVKETERAAPELGLTVISSPVQRAGDLSRALTAALSERPGALSVVGDPVTFGQRALIIDFAAKNRLPSIYNFPEETADGGLMSYGVNLTHHFRQAATYVDRILRGARPADLPVEQPTVFEFVVNLRTAKALGLTIPQSIMGRADKVID